MGSSSTPSSGGSTLTQISVTIAANTPVGQTAHNLGKTPKIDSPNFDTAGVIGKATADGTNITVTLDTAPSTQVIATVNAY